MIKRLQDKVIRKYGFENWRTILVFRVTGWFERRGNENE